MLPILPFDILLPATVILLGIFFFLVMYLVGRRLMIVSRGSRLQHFTNEAEAFLRASIAGGEVTPGFWKWLEKNTIGKPRAFVQAVERLEAGGISPASLHAFIIDKKLLNSFRRSIRRAKNRWLRAECVWAFGRLGYLEIIPSLSKAITDPDKEVCYVAAQSLSEINHVDSLKVLAREIRTNSHTENTRLAALIEAMNCEVNPTIREMIKDPDPEKQFWGIRLIGEKSLFELIEEIKPLITSPSANIRCACAESIGKLKLRLTDRWLQPLIFDEMWFVQVQAAKALGKMKASWAVPDLCELLTSDHWWVRHMASEALIDLGEEVTLEVEAIIMNSEDKFARFAAVKVLERFAWIDNLLTRAFKEDPMARLCLLRFVESGGLSHLENALQTAPIETLPLALDLLYIHGDDATYGRIRSALSRMPESLQATVLNELKRWRP